MVIAFKDLFVAVITALSLSLLCSAVALAVIPNSDNPEAYTEKQYRLDLLEYNKQTMSGAYLEVGHRDPRWDDLVVEFLDAQSVRFVNYKAYKTAKVPETASKERGYEIAKQLKELGCTDPMAGYVILLHTKSKEEGYLDYARWVYQSLLDSDYPVNRKTAIAWRLARLLNNDDHKDEAAEVVQSWVDMICEAVADPELSLENQYFMFRVLKDQIDEDWLSRWESVCERIDIQEPANPWLVSAICGFYHVEAGWEVRGGGYANTVTDEGWVGFKEHMNSARKHLVNAWEVAPQFPDVPARMIAVSMADSSGEERLWFGRAVEAQFDYYRAYSSYIWSLRPRWGGSLDEIYAFGVECLETDRVDTRVPNIFYKVMIDLYSETDDYSYWGRPGAYENFMRYYDAMKREPGGEGDITWWDSMKAAYAWRVGRYQEAAQQIEALGEDFIPKVFSKLGGEPVLAQSEIYVRLNPTTDAVADRVDRLWDQGRHRRAGELLDGTLLGLVPGDPARVYLENKAAQSRWKHKNAQGVWADLLGRTDMGGWDVERGAWSMDEQGRLTGHSLENGLAAVCRLKFGYRYELKGSLECLQSPDPQEANGGVLMVYKVDGSLAYHRDVLLFPQKQSVLAARTFKYATESYPAELQPRNTFHLQVWDRYVRLTVNDVVVIENRQMPRKLSRTVYRFALGGYYDEPGGTIRYDELKIKRLRQRPDWIDLSSQTPGKSEVSQ